MPPLLISMSFSLLMNYDTFFICLSKPFGIAFDIDGVILRGRHTIGGSAQALQRLYHQSGNSLLLSFFCSTYFRIGIHFFFHLFFFVGALKVPFLFLTNGIIYLFISFFHFSSWFNCISPTCIYDADCRVRIL